ncbi:hypothetical protein F511_23630 [Dorcoceras hygrometricum]|uniref:Uncharacterized protein n=1 Tax=Dorcoceras hygrometricum TaxID=472368 RepID=A0A2Z7CY61_9LAMI|nr:hypothetical protein F511_23630 [Dorcoceras hygrometricum]
MRAVKESVNLGQRVSWQIKSEPLYHAQPISRWKSSSVIFRAGHSITHHSSAIFRHDLSVGHHSDDSVGPFRHDTSVCDHNVALSRVLNQSSGSIYLTRTRQLSLHQYAPSLVSATTAGTAWELKSRISNELRNSRFNCRRNSRTQGFLRAPPTRRIRSPNWYQSKELSNTSSAPPVLLQTTAEIEGDLEKQCSVNSKGFEGISEGDRKYRVQKYAKYRSTLVFKSSNLASVLINSDLILHLCRNPHIRIQRSLTADSAVTNQTSLHSSNAQQQTTSR